MRTQQPLRRLLTAFAGIAMLMLQPSVLGPGSHADAAASVGIVIIDLTFENVPVPNTCNPDEIISETGAARLRAIIVASAGRGFNLHLHFQFKATGISNLGNEYIVNQEGKERLINVPPLGGVFTHTDNYVQISKGGAPNTKLYSTYTLVIQPDGSFEVRNLDFRLGCHG